MSNIRLYLQHTKDAFQVFGVFNRNGKLAVAQFAAEPLLTVHSIVSGLNLLNQCPRHHFHQMHCPDPLCEQCRGRSVDVEDVGPIYLPGIIGREALKQMPVLPEREEEIRRDGRGNILPSDVDWAKFEQSPRE